MKKITSIALGIFCFTFLAVSVFGQKYETSPTGLKYRYFLKGKEGKKPGNGDMVDLSTVFRTKDTVFIDSRKTTMPFVMPVMESVYKGDIFSAFRLMNVGDSIEIVLNADSLFLNTWRLKEIPGFIKSGSNIYISMKLNKIQSQEDFQAEMKTKMDVNSKQKQRMAGKEDSLMKAYIQSHNIKVKPSETGVYLVETKKGTGAKVEAGKKVKVHYTGLLTIGTKFDSSYDRNSPIEVTVGAGQVIKGWDEALQKMSLGGKYTVIIPSNMAYGERGFGSTIPPYQPLVFEMEVVEVK